jgi:hypothetical protein
VPKPSGVELVGLRWNKEARGWPELRVTVKNFSGEPVTDFKARPSFWTKDGQLIERGPVTDGPPLPLLPGRSASFTLQNIMHSRSTYVTVTFEDSQAYPLQVKETVQPHIDLLPSMMIIPSTPKR